MPLWLSYLVLALSLIGPSRGSWGCTARTQRDYLSLCLFPGSSSSAESAQCLAGSMLKLDVGWIPYSQLPSPATGQPGRDSSTRLQRLSPKCCFCRHSAWLRLSAQVPGGQPQPRNPARLRDPEPGVGNASTQAGQIPQLASFLALRSRLIRQAQHSQNPSPDPCLLT